MDIRTPRHHILTLRGLLSQIVFIFTGHPSLAFTALE
jgi:hypothetical protein